MKVSLRIAKKGNPKHNDRSRKEPEEHVDVSRSKNNHYMSIYKDLKNDFLETEKRFYSKLFNDWIEEKKSLAKEHRHRERVKSADQLRTGQKTKPEEMVIQIGDVFEHPSSEAFRLWAQEVVALHRKLTKDHAQVLNVAIHNDEGTPHAHIRQVWVYGEKTKDGKPILRISKNKALEAAGFQPPFPDQPIGRKNSRAMTYTKVLREEIEKLAIEKGFDIDTTNRVNRKHLHKDDYIKMKEAERELERQKNTEKKNDEK